MKKCVLLGASGSIGKQTLDIINRHPNDLKCVAFSVGKNISLIDSLLTHERFELICVQNKEDYDFLSVKYPDQSFVYGDKGLIACVELNNYDILINALVGFVGLSPTLKAIELGKDIALANKETLVVAGQLVMQKIDQYKVHLYPIDSEHSGLQQILYGHSMKEVNSLIITASGGSFRDLSREQLEQVTIQDALQHPNWSMGAKITIDSATMVNKAFEVIEAHWLFNMDYQRIKVILHPESIVHALVEFKDYSVIAQMANADMRLPIQYALMGVHSDLNQKPLDLASLKSLNFKEMDDVRYPLFSFILKKVNLGGNQSTLINASNEIAVNAFLNDEISFLDIEKIIIGTVETIPYKELKTLEDFIKADQEARAFARAMIQEGI